MLRIKLLGAPKVSNSFLVTLILQEMMSCLFFDAWALLVTCQGQQK